MNSIEELRSGYARLASLTPALPLLALVAVLISPQPASAHAITGAIFTTTQDGSAVDKNIYIAKCGADGVWLNGGPQGPNPGLPEGDYVFQVTDPSGGTLLSIDMPAHRLVHVDSSGRFVNLHTDSYGDGTHQTSDLLSPTRITVELCPFHDTPNPGGEYKVWLTRVSDFIDPNVGNCSLATGLNPLNGPCNGAFGFVPGHIKTDNFKAPGDEGGGPPAGILSIEGKKFYDANVSGQDDGEAGIPGWKVCIFGGPTDFESFCKKTDSEGAYSFTDLEPGTYTVCEVIPSTLPIWIPTTATSIPGISISSSNSTDNDFGNVCLGQGGGKTLGFWSNKNGQAMIDGNDLCALTALNLRNYDGTNFDPVSCPNPDVVAGKNALKVWLLSANATNMAYMLSAQLAAMELNVLNNGVNPGSIVYAPGCGKIGLNNAFISISDLINDANTELGSHGLTPAGNQYREYQECLKNALDKANNNLNFVQPSACSFDYRDDETCIPNDQ